MSVIRDSSANVDHFDETRVSNAVNDVARNASVLAIAKVAIRDFLTRMGYAEPDCPRDIELEARVKKITQTWAFEKRIHPHIVTALVLTETAYRHLSDIDAKVAITIFTAFATSMDDPAILDALESREFHSRLCSGTIQQDDGMLGAFTKHLADMKKYFPPFGAATIIASALQFVNVSIIENTTSSVPLHPSSLPFLEYRRGMSGVYEAYTCFIFEGCSFPDASVYMQVIPDAGLYIDYANDILSFYKEELQGETANYVHDRAIVTGKDPLDTLREVINEASSAAQRVRDILGEGPARDAWDNFTMGYIRFHSGSPRYRLQDILGATNKYLIETAEWARTSD